MSGRVRPSRRSERADRPPDRRLVLSFVEKGWAGPRQLSIELSKRGVPVRHLVKGRIPAEVIRVIPPYEGVSIHGVPRRWFRFVIVGELLWWWMGLRLALVFADSRPTEAWLRRWFPFLREKLVLVQERFDGAPLVFRGGARVEPELVFPERVA